MPRLYLQVEVDVFDHPKVLAIVAALKLPKVGGADLVVAFLERWWGYCAKFGSRGKPAVCPTSVLDGFALAMFEKSKASSRPEPAQLLRSSGLMDRYGRPHDWQDFTGALLTRRAKDAERHRNVRRQSAEAPRSVPRREEKRREEKSRTGQKPPDVENPSVKTTWLTPYANLWREHFSTDLPFGQAAKVLKPLVDEHGDAATRKALGNYLAAHSGERAAYVSLPKFASTFGQWLNPSGPKTREQRNFEQIDAGLPDEEPA